MSSELKSHGVKRGQEQKQEGQEPAVKRARATEDADGDAKDDADTYSSLHLVPSKASLEASLDAVVLIGGLYTHNLWGGVQHMSLCSFATKEQHGRDPIETAESMLQAGISRLQRLGEPALRLVGWNGKYVKSVPSWSDLPCVIMKCKKGKGTLSAMVKLAQGLEGAGEAAKNLHVTVPLDVTNMAPNRKMGNGEWIDLKEEMVGLFGGLEWELQVVQCKGVPAPDKDLNVVWRKAIATNQEEEEEKKGEE